MPALTQTKLRRLASRAIRVIGRHKGISGVAAFETTLLPVAEQYIEAYEQNRAQSVLWTREHSEGRGATKTLVHGIRMWAAVVATHVDNVRRGSFGDNPGVPDDIAGDARELIELVKTHDAESGSPLPYSAQLEQELTEALEAAKVEWNQAEGSTNAFREHQRTVRELAEKLRIELIGLRRTLAVALGTSHADYQKLRADRAINRDVDDDVVVEETDESDASNEGSSEQVA